MSTENDEDQVIKLKKLLSRASNHIDDITGQLNLAKKDNAELKKKNSEVEHALEDVKSSKHSLEKRVEELQITVEKNQAIISDNEKKIIALKAQASSSQEGNKEYEDMKERLSDATKKILKFEQEVVELQRKNKQLDDDIGAKESEIKSLQSKIELLESDNNNKEERIQELTKEKLDVEEDYKRYKVKVNAIAERNKDTHDSEEFKISQEVNLKLREKIKELQTTKVELETKLVDQSDKELQFQELKQMLEKSIQENTTLSSKLEELKRHEAKVLLECENKISLLSEQLDNSKEFQDAELEKMRNNLNAQIKANNDSFKEQLKKLTDQIKVKDEEIRNLLDEVEILKNTKPDTLTQEIVSHTNHEQKDAFVEKEDQVKSIEELADVQSKFDKKLFKYEQEIEELRKSLTDAEKTNELLSAQAKLLKEELRKSENSEKLVELKESNMDLLKNVVVKHLETGEFESLLPVLADLLKLTQEEVSKIKQNMEKRRSSENEGFTSSIWKVFGSPL